jgi:ABC transport system ATP-binding/permease protein
VSNFPGTVLLVSHDRVFLDRVVTSTLAFEGGGRVTEYVGGYEDYLRQRSQPASEPASPKPRSGEGGPKPAGGEGGKSRSGEAGRPSGSRKLTYKEQKELDGLPKRIAALEEEQRKLQADIASPEFYKSPKDQIAAMLARAETVQVELDAALERWVELDAAGRAS